jgi:predicted transposase YbfD/YdcC
LIEGSGRGLLAAMKRQTVAEREKEELAASIVDYFAELPDPRMERTRQHSLLDILVLTLCAVISGANSFTEIEGYGRAKEDWLRTFLDLPNGIPSHDTLGRVFAALCPAALADAFRRWVAAVADLTKGEVVAIDGKTLRRSFREAGSKSFVHMVSAFATSNRVVLAQVKTDEKSNEITAIPRLLQLLTIKGCLVTIDAMGCQKEIASSIIDADADYLLAVKDNQPTLKAEIASILDRIRRDPTGLDLDFHETCDRGHGRTEVRRCWTTGLVECLSQQREWRGLSSMALIEVDRTVDGHTSTEQRYYICSQVKPTARSVLASSRRHWGIENEVHWVLDVAFREDDCRIRAGNAAENFAVMRHLALNLLKATKNAKGGIHARRLRAGWDNAFLLQVLSATP